MKKPLWFVVRSPEYLVVDVILDDGTGPSELIRDWLYARAMTPERARVLTVRAFRRRYKGLRKPDYLRDNPFVGMQVQLAGQTPSAGGEP